METVWLCTKASIRIHNFYRGPALAAECGGLDSNHAACVRDDRYRAAAHCDHCAGIKWTARDGDDVTTERAPVLWSDVINCDAAVCVCVCIGVCVCVCIGVCIGVAVCVGISVGVGVGIGVGIAVCVSIGIRVRISVAVCVGVSIGVGISIGINDDAATIRVVTVWLAQVARVTLLVKRESAAADEQADQESADMEAWVHGSRLDTPRFILNNEIGP